MIGSTPSSTAPAPAASATSTTSRSSLDNLGKQEFLKLLIAQLRNQDPMNPMDDRQFITQLAQFRSLEALDSVNQQLEVSRKDQQITQATLLIGKPVEARTEGGEAVSGLVTEVRVIDGNPRVVVGDKTLALAQIVAIRASAGSQTAGNAPMKEKEA
jgi:flagellar basal-body rod modification protein FlgD